MSTTQPIRNREALKEFKRYYLDYHPNPRNYTLIVVGLNTALRINDLLHITRQMVCQGNEIRDHITVTEKKTGKENRIYLNQEVKSALSAFFAITGEEQNPYIFHTGRSVDAPLSRCQAYRIIREAAEAVGLGDHISCHSLRKTFGYHAWKQGTPPALLMSIYNHSSFGITKYYLCIDQDDKDSVFEKILL